MSGISENVVHVRGAVKRFGSTAALDGLDLEVRRGEIHGFLGPNGAGKSTTLRVLLGLLRVDAGEVSVFDRDPWRDVRAVHQRLAYVPGDVALWPNLTGGEVIDLLGRLQGGWSAQRRDDLLQIFDLDPTKRTRAYSRGNRQKVALIAALASDVELYLLDEPTAGLDPLKEADFRHYVQGLRDQGRTVLLSSHILSEAEALSDRVTIIRDGRAVETGRLEDLRHLRLTTVIARVRHVPSGLPLLDGVQDVTVDGDRVTARATGDGLAALLRLLADTGLEDLESRPPTLEEVFLQHYGATAEVVGDHG